MLEADRLSVFYGGIYKYKPYSREWKLLEHGEDRNVYRRFTEVEPCVSLIFSIFYALTIVLAIVALLLL